jgi:2-iminobutanoate/2-iminopropanoate deaminase
MKYLLIITVGLLALTSCKDKEAAKTAETKKVPTDRKYIIPEGYNQGLPFSPGILVDGTLYIAGFSGEDPKTGIPPEDFEVEVKQTLDKIGVILKEADMNYSDVVSVQVYLTDMKLFDRMNAVYKTYFPEPRPTRSIMGIKELIGPARLEITVTAKK